MNPSLQDHPVSNREQWLDARRRLLAREKQLTRLRDQVAAERRELPWVRVDKDYRFQGERGERSLAELFGGNSQLIVYHFMFAPGWSEGCVGCSFLADHIDGTNRHLAHHDVSLVAVSRAPLEEFQAFRRRMGWRFDWYSSYGSDFNRDFGVSFDKAQLAAGSVDYNYQPTPRRRRGNAGCQRVPAQSGGRGVPHLFGLCARPRHPAHHLQLPRPDAQGAQRGRDHGLAASPRPLRRGAEKRLLPCAGQPLREHGEPLRSRIEALYREESRRVLATLIRLLGDFELAEEALHDAFIAAVEQWPRDGIPRNPRAWLVSAGRFKAIDNLRRRARFDASQRLLAEQLEEQAEAPAEEGDAVEDDRLRLIFTCCHPALTPEAQVALTLREVCDLRTEEIARAFLAAPSAIAQRIVRAKNKIREARIPYQVPTLEELPERLGNVLQVIYLVFNEGYSASTGASLTRADLSGEAIRVGRLLVELLPDPEALGLLALMLLHDSRRQARISASGELVRLDEQDRALWDRGLIVEGLGLVERALASRRVGPYTLQAAIVAVHAQAPRAEDTDWARIVALYDALLYLAPSPVVELNRAVALAMRDGVEVGLAVVDALLARGELADYHLAHSARADFCRRLGRRREAREAYRAALALARQEPERRFIEQRLRELD